MNLKPLSSLSKKILESSIGFWIICFLTGVLTQASITSFISTTKIEFDNMGSVSQTTLILAFSLIPIYEIIVMRLMPKHIVKHLSRFRPVLDLPDSEYNNLQSHILSATISNNQLWFLTATILLSNVFIFIFLISIRYLTYEILYKIVWVYFLFLIIPSFFLLTITSRVLWHISNLRNFPLKVNLLDTKPLLTLSELTQKFALYLIPIATFFGWFDVNVILTILKLIKDQVPIEYILNLKGFQAIIVVLLILLGPLLLILSVCVFVLPVLWVRYLIIERKTQALSNIAQKLLASFREHDKMIEMGDLSNINTVTTSINALNSRAETYKRISELPWEMQTLRQFLGAVILPAILWVIQYYLGNFLAK